VADAIEIRRARAADAATVADLYLASIHATYDFPLAHSDDEVRAWIAGTLIPSTETWVACDPAGAIVGFMSLGDDFLDQLYLLPGATGQGIGSRLVELAKARRPAGLDLYTFQVNTGARRFYERHGFRDVARGDGSGNEEGQPDIRYAWRP
jgi:ribosomal protein S18 acetylase RimI-like enzyme